MSGNHRVDGEDRPTAGETDDGPWGEPIEVRRTVPHVARMYDYLLGGRANFAVDRRLVEHAAAALPGGIEQARVSARANRQFLVATVRWLAGDLGVRQFLDIGCGLPTDRNVHEVAQAEDPTCRVVYVDHDLVVLANARRLMPPTPDEAIADLDAAPAARPQADPPDRRPGVTPPLPEPAGRVPGPAPERPTPADVRHEPATVAADRPGSPPSALGRAAGDHARRRGSETSDGVRAQLDDDGTAAVAGGRRLRPATTGAVPAGRAWRFSAGTPEGATAYLDADLREPDDVLHRAGATLDLGEPVAVLLFGVLDYVLDDEGPEGLAARLLDAVAPGSYLVVTHFARDVHSEAVAEFVWRHNSGLPDELIVARSRDEVARILGGGELLDPGVAPIDRWLHPMVDGRHPTPIHGAVARRP